MDDPVDHGLRIWSSPNTASHRLNFRFVVMAADWRSRASANTRQSVCTDEAKRKEAELVYHERVRLSDERGLAADVPFVAAGVPRPHDER